MEIARRTGVPKATVSRLTHTLLEYGYLNYSEELAKYSIAPGILALGYSVLASDEIHVQARPLMERLAREEPTAAYGLGVRSSLYVIYLASAKGRTTLVRDTSVGFRVPLAGSATGWACLAGMRPQEREIVFQQLRREHDKHEWPAVERKIEEGIADVRAQGFCVSVGDVNPAYNAAAVPFIYQGRRDIYVFNAVAPAYAFNIKRMTDEVGPKLLAMVEQLHGGRPPVQGETASDLGILPPHPAAAASRRKRNR